MRSGKVLLAFSGGIDSYRSAELLLEQGYGVTALTLNTTGDIRMLDDARAKAAGLGIGYMEVDVRNEFRHRIVDYFTSEYLKGRTPAPCTLCNSMIKWKTLYDTAIAEGFGNIATGHYFNVVRSGGKYYVAKGADPLKDQSYYLWQLPQHILAMALTPMGNQIKEVVKQNLPEGASRRESMGVCFLGGRSCRDFLEAECGRNIVGGSIVDHTGNAIGTHDGYPYYTIGQKKGMGLPSGMCIVGINPDDNLLIAGTDSELYHRNLVISDYCGADIGEILTAPDITVTIRGIGRNPEGHCRITAIDGKLQISLENPAWAPAKGQPVVLYRANRVVGGGILEEYF